MNCWDISSAVENGVVTFNNADRTYGTIATATCNSGYTISGATTLTCNTGVWDQDLPTCTCTQEGGCSGKKLIDRMEGSLCRSHIFLYLYPAVPDAIGQWTGISGLTVKRLGMKNEIRLKMS